MRSIPYLITAMLMFASAPVAQRHSQNNCRTEAFVVSCPAGWYVLDRSRVNLDLLNFPPSERLNGVIIKDRGAQMTIELGHEDISGIDSWIAEDARTEETSKPMPVGTDAANASCRELRAVDAEVNVGAVERDISVYCATNAAPLPLPAPRMEG